jgi:membrane-associated protease RseP (regulator of RpoE activity)
MIFALAVMGFLLAHEMGHYLACRYYRVDATLPFLIPSPWIPFFGLLNPLVGTFGAVIRIRGPIPHRRALFDIGIAGPLAGFAACLVVLYLGVRETEWVRVGEPGLYLGDPLLLQWAIAWMKGPAPPDMVPSLGPVGLSAWFGLLVTALNLIPVGQLDGGHVMYALLRQRAHVVSRYAWWGCVGLIYFSPSWILWAALLRLLGRRHPPTWDDGEPVGSGRALVGVLGLAVLVVSFIPSPLLGSWDVWGEALRELFGPRRTRF